MQRNKYVVIGAMSGTSLDGLDLCLVEFNYDKKWSFSILDSTTIPYPEFWKEKLSQAHLLSKIELNALDDGYSKYLGSLAKEFLNSRGADFLSSHGHTVFHDPKNGITFQLGNLKGISEASGLRTICNYRVQDVKMGGQGAPLVPIGDKLLFGEYSACLNLGGFANISFDDEKGARIAFDTCPCNMLLNLAVNKLSKDYDENGLIARSGIIDEDLLNQWNSIDYYHLNPPKSLGREWFAAHYLECIDNAQISEIPHILTTACEHIAMQIGKSLSELTGTCLATGGGAFNAFLVERIEHYVNMKIIIPEAPIIEQKEALVFAFLGVLKMRGEHNILASVTGAERDHCSGEMFN